MPKKMSIVSFILNLAIVVLSAFAIVLVASGKSVVHYEEEGMLSFRYFTVDSIALVAVLSIPMLICSAMYLLGKRTGPIPVPVLVLKYIGTVSSYLTCLVVIGFFIPYGGLGNKLSGVNFLMHLFCSHAIDDLFCFIRWRCKTVMEESMVTAHTFFVVQYSLCLYGDCPLP